MSNNKYIVDVCMPYGNNTASTLYNFSYITFYHYNFCVTMVRLEVYFLFALTIPMVISLLLLILITLFGDIKEDYK
uniref:NADH dehydrogenase subunit 6 n=1 Tax=Acrobeloides nanus TaxID=290746 RepID=A0A914CG02_9BILA